MLSLEFEERLKLPRESEVALARFLGLVPAVVSLGACGIIWDAGGQRYALGFGYVSWPLPDAGRPAVVHGYDAIGLAVLATATSQGVMVGYSSERIVTLDGDRVVALDCLQCDLAGSNPDGGTTRGKGEKTQ